MRTIDWHYDILSPFARVQLAMMGDLPDAVTVRPVPTLLGAVLKHWGQRGPAEIAPKRVHTYRLVTWLARRHGVTLAFPPRHPFNPLPAMRLLAGLEADLDAVRAAFVHVWDHGNAPDDEAGLRALADALGADPSLAVADRSKLLLRAATDGAIGRGVFGVPTFAVPGENRGVSGSENGSEDGHALFWGVDAMPMLVDYLADPALFDGMADLDAIEFAVARR